MKLPNFLVSALSGIFGVAGSANLTCPPSAPVANEAQNEQDIITALNVITSAALPNHRWQSFHSEQGTTYRTVGVNGDYQAGEVLTDVYAALDHAFNNPLVDSDMRLDTKSTSDPGMRHPVIHEADVERLKRNVCVLHHIVNERAPKPQASAPDSQPPMGQRFSKAAKEAAATPETADNAHTIETLNMITAASMPGYHWIACKTWGETNFRPVHENGSDEIPGPLHHAIKNAFESIPADQDGPIRVNHKSAQDPLAYRTMVMIEPENLQLLASNAFRISRTLNETIAASPKPTPAAPTPRQDNRP